MAIPYQYLTSGSKIPTTSWDLDEEQHIGISMPLRNSEVSGSTGYFESTKYTIDAIKENVKNLLNTHRGERIFNADFGINWNKYLFQQVSESVKEQMSQEIRVQLIKYMPYLTVQNIQIMERSDDSDLILFVFVKVSYKSNSVNIARAFDIGYQQT